MVAANLHLCHQHCRQWYCPICRRWTRLFGSRSAPATNRSHRPQTTARRHRPTSLAHTARPASCSWPPNTSRLPNPSICAHRRSNRTRSAGRITSDMCISRRPSLPNAVASFERALSMRPDDVATLVWLGGVHLDQGQPELAEPLYTRALAIQPRAVSALFGLGRAALAKREYARAVDQFEQALAADPRANLLLTTRSRLRIAAWGTQRRPKRTWASRGRVEVGPPDPLMAELRGLLHGAVAEENRGIRALDAGDFDTAAEHFRRGLELAPRQPVPSHTSWVRRCR